MPVSFIVWTSFAIWMDGRLDGYWPLGILLLGRTRTEIMPISPAIVNRPANQVLSALPTSQINLK